MVVEVPVRYTNYPARDYKQLLWGTVIPANERWHKEGKITDNDPYPWLRSAQLQGHDLCIVGSTPAAIRVCVEAWHAGFKPCLVVHEDRVTAEDEPKMRAMISKLMGYKTFAGKLRTGVNIMMSEASKCHASLDSKGHITSLFVASLSKTNHMTSEQWKLFHGPAIVVDPFIAEHNCGVGKETANNDDENETTFVPLEERKELHRKMMAQERDLICDPAFWDDRFDPNTLGFFAWSYDAILPNLFIGVGQMALIFLVNKFHHDPLFPLYRGIFDFPSEMGAMFGLAGWMLWILGIATVQMIVVPPTALVAFSHFAAGWLAMIPYFEGIYYTSDFFDSGFAMNATLSMSLFYAKFVRKSHITRWTLLWLMSCILGSVGAWLECTACVVAYQGLLATSPAAASLFLSFGFTFLEAAQVKWAAITYDLFVVKPRRTNINSIINDQKKGIGFCIGGTHTFVECGRLMSLICGAATATGTDFLPSVLQACVVNLIMNTFSRSGWQAHLISMVAKKLRLGFIHNIICPGGIGAVHQAMKYSCGYTRFSIAIGVFVGRGILHGNWSTPLLVQPGVEGATCWCISGVTLITVCMALLFEMIEDIAASYFEFNCVPPHWQRFQDAVLAKFDHPMKSNIMNLTHLVIPVAAVNPMSADSRASSWEGKNTASIIHEINSVKNRRSRTSRASHVANLDSVITNDQDPSKVFGQDPTRLCFGPNFKCCFKSMPLEANFFIAASGVACLAMLAVGMGSGFLFGYCPLLDFDKIPIKVRSMVLWSKYCE